MHLQCKPWLSTCACSACCWRSLGRYNGRCIWLKKSFIVLILPQIRQQTRNFQQAKDDRCPIGLEAQYLPSLTSSQYRSCTLSLSMFVDIRIPDYGISTTSVSEVCKESQSVSHPVPKVQGLPRTQADQRESTGNRTGWWVHM